MTADVPLSQLDEFRWNWDRAYKIVAAGGHCLAQRRDDGRTLTVDSPEALRELVIQDYEAEPVSCDAAPLVVAWPGSLDSYSYLKAAVLQSCFPSYAVSVLSHRDGRPRFQVISRDGSSPYCMISDDASEVWDELRRGLPDSRRPYAGQHGDGLFVWTD
jgi:hypothetical protein